MNTQFLIEVIKYCIKGNGYWLTLFAYVRRFDVCEVYTIDFCGTEIHTNIPLNDKELEKLKNLLVDDFGYGPFNDD